MHFACMLGQKFSILTMWGGWVFAYTRHLNEYKLWDRCASIRHIGQVPDLVNLLQGKRQTLRKLEAEALKAINEDGADVIMLGSTTMHQAHEYLSKRLSVPVLNPGLVAYKIAEALIDMNLTQSKHAYPEPRSPRDDMVHAMAEAAQKFPWPPK
jgi:allantoin racemase